MLESPSSVLLNEVLEGSLGKGSRREGLVQTAGGAYACVPMRCMKTLKKKLLKRRKIKREKEKNLEKVEKNGRIVCFFKLFLLEQIQTNAGNGKEHGEQSD